MLEVIVHFQYLVGTAKAFKRSLFMTDLRYVFNFLRVEKDLSEEQFVTDVHRNILSAMST